MVGKPRMHVATVEFWHRFGPKEWKAFAEGAEGKPAPCTEAADPDLFYAWQWGDVAKGLDEACGVAGQACVSSLRALPGPRVRHGPHDPGDPAAPLPPIDEYLGGP